MDFISRQWDAYERSAMTAWHAVQHAWTMAGAPVEMGALGHDVMRVVTPLAAAWACAAVLGTVAVLRRA